MWIPGFNWLSQTLVEDERRSKLMDDTRVLWNRWTWSFPCWLGVVWYSAVHTVAYSCFRHDPHTSFASLRVVEVEPTSRYFAIEFIFYRNHYSHALFVSLLWALMSCVLSGGRYYPVYLWSDEPVSRLSRTWHAVKDPRTVQSGVEKLDNHILR